MIYYLYQFINLPVILVYFDLPNGAWILSGMRRVGTWRQMRKRWAEDWWPWLAPVG